jgi:hypothetical protein
MTIPDMMQKEEGAAYFKALYAYNAPQVASLVAAIKKGEPLHQLRLIYSKTRPAYEQLEVLAPAFPDEDEQIDSRPYGFDSGVLQLCPNNWCKCAQMCGVVECNSLRSGGAVWMVSEQCINLCHRIP